MLKKIIVIIALVGISGLLIWGGVNRTLAKTTENKLQTSDSNAHGNLGKGVDTNLNLGSQDCQENEDNRLLHGGQGLQNLDNDGHQRSESQQNSNRGTEYEGYLSNGQNSTEKGNGNGRGAGSGGAVGGGFSTLTESEIEALHMALDDEYHAFAVYQAVIADFGEIAPFVEIAASETRHIEALLKHFEKHDILPPENTWLGNVPSFDSVQDACQAGVEAELANIALYEQLFSMVDDPGLIQVFTNLSQASRESHLPEFQSCQ